MSAGSVSSMVELPPRLRRAIERQRRRLPHATALLNCLMVAAMYDESIDASAVAKVACSLVSKAPQHGVAGRAVMAVTVVSAAVLLAAAGGLMAFRLRAAPLTGS